MQTNIETIERNGERGVAVVSGGGRLAPIADQEALLPIYLTSMRLRFKNEINRLTSGRAMLEMLGDRDDAIELSFPMSYLYAWYWLRHNVHTNYMPQVLETFRGAKFGFLMDLLLSESAEKFIEGYIRHWQSSNVELKQRTELLGLLARSNNNAQQLADEMFSIWQSFGLFTENYMVQFKQVSREERDRYAGMLGAEDLERLALVDALPDVDFNNHYSKLGIIPAMGCPQTCRHCMFTWRPPHGKNENPEQVFELVNEHTDSVLFTGGDLTKQLDYFYRAIRSMSHIKNFALLLNGDFANTAKETNETMGKMAEAIKQRPKKWPKAKVLLQISFDEFHQEVYVDKKGLLAERIPVAKIANIVERYPKYAGQIQLALLHKQTNLNFSHDVLNKGVVARLAAELASRGHQMQVMDMQPSPRLKVNPTALNSSTPRPQEKDKILKDVTFILDKHKSAPILLTSSTIDGYGRAALLDEWETVKEKDLLQQVITQGVAAGESFDIDMMIWFNGWVTLFNAVHICLGDHYKDGIETIKARQRKDPLSQALNKMDRVILDLYKEIRDDLDQQIDAATGPHHLFHALTEEPEVRLYLTRRLIEENR